MAEPGDSLQQLVNEYRGRRLSRRDFLTRALALGLAAPAASALLASMAPAAQAAPAGRGAPAPAAQQEPKRGGILREGYDLDFSRMDPINTNWYDPGFFALYEAIITTDPSGKLVPQLASKWEWSEDATTVTFTIRPNLKFHSGDPLDAAAIRDVYLTIMDPKSGSPLRTLTEPIDTIEAPDPTTLVVKLKHPYYGLLHVLKTGYWRIVNTRTRARLGDEYGKKEIDGSGPFLFEEWVPGSHVSVKRWDEYPGSLTPYITNPGPAYLDGIRWIAILEAAQRAVQIENGEIDTLHGPAFQDVDRLMGNPDLTVITLKEWSGYIAGLNWKKTQLGFDDIRVRQAISHAIDRESLVKALLFGQGEPMYGPLPSADLYYAREVEQYNRFDLAQAKQLMADAGWTPGADGILEKGGQKLSFSMDIQAESFNQQLGAAIQAQLRELGCDVKVIASDRGTYFNKLFGGEGESFIFFYLWPVPLDVVTLFINSAAMNGGPNWANASVPAIDEAIARYQSAANADEQAAASRKLQLLVAEHLPIIPIINRNNIWVHRNNVHGWLPHQWNLYPYYNDVWLG